MQELPGQRNVLSEEDVYPVRHKVQGGTRPADPSPLLLHLP